MGSCQYTSVRNNTGNKGTRKGLEQHKIMKRSGTWSILTLIALLLPSAPSQTLAGEDSWYLFARDDGCVSLQLLVSAENLKRAPVSPEDFAGMMRARGEQVSIGLPEGFPSGLLGKAVQVKYGSNAVLFVTEEICRTAR